MKIKHFCNSFLSISERQTCLACDPWVGITSHGGCMSTPISSGGRKILKDLNPTHFYISHLHADHIGGLPIYEENILTTLTKKNITLFIKKFKLNLLYRRLTKLGFKNIIELNGWETHKISDDLEITIIPTDVTNTSDLEDEINYDLDTSILIRSLVDGTYFYNNVDSPMSINGLRKVKEFVKNQGHSGTIDVACMGVGSASEYPQCFPKIDRQAEKNKIINSSLTRFGERLAALENQVYFPAGGDFFIPGKFSSLNQYIAKPSFEQESLVVTSSKNCNNIFDFSGGGTIEKRNGKWICTKGKLHSFPSREDAIKENNNLIYEYRQIPENIDNRNDEELFDLARKNYFETLKKLDVNIKWKVEFHLYDDLQLDDHAKIKGGMTPLKSLVLIEDTSVKPPYELICHLDRQLFRGLLNNICIWNTTLGGMLVIFERNPNVFIPTITFSLNYLVLPNNERVSKGDPIKFTKY